MQLTTWQTAYPRFIPRFAIDQVDLDWLMRRWRAAITEPPSARHHVLVAVEQAGGPREPTRDEPASGGSQESHLVGFAAIGPADETALTPDETAAAGEPAGADEPAGASPDLRDLAAITDLLVEPRWGRRGHGSRLLAAAVEVWRSDGFTRAVAWAFEKDAATIKFLTSTGWERDGAARALDIDGIIAPQARLHVSLTDPDPDPDPDAEPETESA